MPPKTKLSFEDLGLTVPLPDVLCKSKAQRKSEQVAKKKESKQRAKETLSALAASREETERHRALVLEEAQRAREAKQAAKRAAKIERIKAQGQREAARREAEQALRAGQREHFAQVQAAALEDQRQAAALREQLDAQVAELARQAPKNVSVAVLRTPEILQQREGLPVLREEQPIMEAVTHATRTCVLVCGETGSGKTTQVPQFLWEAGYGHPEGAALGRDGCVLVTEPRRVAAVSMARRVAEELNVDFGREVGYHVRYDNNISEACRLKFATEGIVLKEIQSDFLLRKYSAIVVDEAHERSISCDLLVGLLSRIVPLRNDLYEEELRKNGGDPARAAVKPLKLVIMSATLRVTDFRDNRTLFPVVPPLINVEARRFPVANHFERRTEMRDYTGAAFAKVCQIHKKLPPGGILVFLCTQREIEDLCERLRAHYRRTRIEYYADSYATRHLLTGGDEFADDAAASSSSGHSGDDGEDGAASPGDKDAFGLRADDYDLATDDGPARRGRGGRGGKRPRDSTRGDGFDGDEDEEEEGDDDTMMADDEALGGGDAGAADEDEANGEFNTLHVLPLYALLDFHKQQEVFKPPPPGTRLCIVATNVAETSITIPNISYVVDAGRVKSKALDPETGASCYRIEWVSQASAEQRSGRAGRVGPGHCYRLYTPAVFANVMPPHSTPEILRTPLDSVVLLMRHIGIDRVGRFPFPSAPAETDIKTAFTHLAAIGALDPAAKLAITETGRQLMHFPVPPRFARAVVEAQRRGCPPSTLGMVLAIVAMCATATNFFTAEGNRLKASKEEDAEAADPRRARVRALLVPGSDLITNLRAFLAYAERPTLTTCLDHCLVHKNMQEARMLFSQLRRTAQHDAEETEEAAEDTNDLSEGIGGGADEGGEGGEAPPPAGLLEPRSRPGQMRALPLRYTREDELLLRQLFIPGLIDQVARLATPQECRTLGVDFSGKRTTKAAYLVTTTRAVVYVHPTSAIARTFPPPEYVTFGFLQRVRRSESKEARTMMLGLTIVTRDWLLACGFQDDADVGSR